MTRPVHIVALGPGDPEQLTLGAWRTLRRADLVYCPATTAPSGRKTSRAGRLLAAAGIEEGRIRYFDLPMNRDREAAEAVYRQIGEEILARCATHDIALAAEGDAGIYSSAHYIGDFLAEHGVGLRYAAGIPAFIAAGAAAGLHIVRQHERLLVTPEVGEAHRLLEWLDDGHSVVVMKPSQSDAALREAIRLRPGAAWHYFERLGSPEEFRTTDPDAILARPFPYFSLLIVRNGR